MNDAMQAVMDALLKRKTQQRPSALSRINGQPVSNEKKQVPPPPQGGVRG